MAHIVSWAILMALPWISLAILSIASGHDCFNGRPLSSDAVDYWREIYSFSQSSDGKFGFYGFEGYPASVGEWGEHGLAPLLAYGLWSKVFGWHPSSIIICNAVICTLAFAAFCFLTRPSVFQSGIIALLWIAYPGVLFHAPSSMMEMVQYAIIIVYVGLALRFGKERSKRLMVLCFAWVVLMAGIRISYIVFFAPIVLIASDFRACSRFWIAAGVALALSVFCWFFFESFIAGFPGGFLSSLGDEGGIAGVIRAILGHGWMGAEAFFGFSEDAAQVTQRYAFTIVLIVCVGYALKGHFKRKRDHGLGSDSALVRTAAACAFVLGLSWLLAVFANDVFDWRDYRMLSPILFGSFLALLISAEGSREYAIAALCVLCTLILLFFARGELSRSVAFDDIRYEGIPAAPSSFNEVELVPLGEEPLDRTMVMMGDWRPSWLPYALAPELGYVRRSGGRPYEDGRPAYMGMSSGASIPDGYELIWESDEGAIARRTDAESS